MDTHRCLGYNQGRVYRMNHKIDTKKQTYLFYGGIGLTASVSLFVAFYLTLIQTSNLHLLITHPYSSDSYLPLYLFLTGAIITAFGLNIAVMTYRWRVYGSPFTAKDSSTGLGAFLGFIASACPICGTTILSALGIAGGLSLLPFQGLELKALAVVLLLIPLWFMWRDMHRSQCSDKSCVTKKDHYIKPTERHHLSVVIALFIGVCIIGFSLLRTDPLFTKDVSAAGFMCPSTEK